MVISTHILTKRMTEETYFLVCGMDYFNSHPHEEDDTGTMETSSGDGISTHILTKRMTGTVESAGTNKAFQLTSSRRG